MTAPYNPGGFLTAESIIAARDKEIQTLKRDLQAANHSFGVRETFWQKIAEALGLPLDTARISLVVKVMAMVKNLKRAEGALSALIEAKVLVSNRLFEEEIDSLDHIISKRGRTIKCLNGRVKNLERQLKQAKEQVTIQSSFIDGLIDTGDDMERQLDSRSDLIVKLEKRLGQRTEQLQQAKGEIEELKYVNTNLQLRVDYLRSKKECSSPTFTQTDLF